LLAVLDAQTAAGKMRTANVLLADLKQMFDFAAERDVIQVSPLAGTKKGKIGGASVARERALTEAEIKLLAGMLPAARMQERSAIAIWLVLATGVRVGELMGAVWADALPDGHNAAKVRQDTLRGMAETEGVKLGIVGAKTWYMPDTKNQRDHTVHLSAFALAQFQKLAALREVERDGEGGRLSPWVFPATDNRKPVCVKSFGKQLADRQREPDARMMNRTKATKALTLPGGKWTAHDLRRTAATLMARLGLPSDTINECLNHKQSDPMARVYIQDRREDDQARAFDALGARLAGLTGGDAVSNIVQLRAA
jgi:integrase